MGRFTLDYRADQIEIALANRAPVQVQGGSVTPDTVRFRLVPYLGVSPSQVTHLKSAIVERLGPQVRIRAHRHEGVVEVEMPRAIAEAISLVHLVTNLATRPEPLSALLGVDQHARLLLLRLPSQSTKHALVTGAASTDRRALLETLALSLAMLNSQGAVNFVVAGVRRLHGLPHLLWPWPVLATVPQTVRALDYLLRTVVPERKRRAGQTKEEEQAEWPRIVVVINCLDNLDKCALDLVLDLIRADPAGIHVIATFQSPAKRDKELRDHFPTFIVGSGEPGEFQLQVNNQVIPFQAATVAQEEITSIIAQLQAKERTASGPGGGTQRIWVEETPPSRPRWRIGWGRLGL
ncbi:MAG: hypothetical protein ACE5H9_13870 [Anaerolineae bacterium]